MPPLLLSIAALRVPVETLFAVTLIMAWEPIVPGSFKIVRNALPCVVRSPVRLKLMLALPTMFPPLPPLLLMIAALRAPPVEMLAAVTLITASDPIVPPVSFKIASVASPCVVRSPVEIQAKVRAPDDVPAGEV